MEVTKTKKMAGKNWRYTIAVKSRGHPEKRFKVSANNIKEARRIAGKRYQQKMSKLSEDSYRQETGHNLRKPMRRTVRRSQPRQRNTFGGSAFSKDNPYW